MRKSGARSDILLLSGAEEVDIAKRALSPELGAGIASRSETEITLKKTARGTSLALKMRQRMREEETEPR
jgi:hypothetical protein